MKCTICGFNNGPTQKICIQCGAVLNKKSIFEKKDKGTDFEIDMKSENLGAFQLNDDAELKQNQDWNTESSNTTIGKIKCKKCGYENNKESNFCEECGSKLPLPEKEEKSFSDKTATFKDNDNSDKGKIPFYFQMWFISLLFWFGGIIVVGPIAALVLLLVRIRKYPEYKKTATISAAVQFGIIVVFVLCFIIQDSVNEKKQKEVDKYIANGEYETAEQYIKSSFDHSTSFYYENLAKLYEAKGDYNDAAQVLLGRWDNLITPTKEEYIERIMSYKDQLLPEVVSMVEEYNNEIIREKEAESVSVDKERQEKVNEDRKTDNDERTTTAKESQNIVISEKNNNNKTNTGNAGKYNSNADTNIKNTMLDEQMGFIGPYKFIDLYVYDSFLNAPYPSEFAKEREEMFAKLREIEGKDLDELFSVRADDVLDLNTMCPSFIQGYQHDIYSTYYHGNTKGGLADGIGMLYIKGGMVDDFFVGNFEKGCITGYGMYIDHGAIEYEGMWKNGYRNGEGIEYFKYEYVKDGYMIEYTPDGSWKFKGRVFIPSVHQSGSWNEEKYGSPFIHKGNVYYSNYINVLDYDAMDYGGSGTRAGLDENGNKIEGYDEVHDYEKYVGIWDNTISGFYYTESNYGVLAYSGDIMDKVNGSIGCYDAEVDEMFNKIYQTVEGWPDGIIAYIASLDLNENSFSKPLEIKKSNQTTNFRVESSNAQEQSFDNPLEDPDGYIIHDSDSVLLTESSVGILSPQELTYARNEIYARHGYVFKSEELNSYFKSKHWYKPNPNFDGKLSEIEKTNAGFIKDYQSTYGLMYEPK